MAAIDPILNQLLNSSEPSVRYKAQVNILGRDSGSPEVHQLQQEIMTSPRVQVLLSERDSTGKLPYHPYNKWLGAHWLLACLADIGYPAGDESLLPLRQQVQDWLLSEAHLKSIKTLNGRVRRCGSQEGNAVYAMFALGLADDRTAELADHLLRWQWVDGGWNCDKNPSASHSSFMETLIPLRGLNLYGRATGSRQVQAAVERAAEVFLKRNLYQRQQDNSIISPVFTRLHYPCYWHYDILFGLKVMAETGLIGDQRCQPALDMLASRRLPGGGFAADAKFYQVTRRKISGRSLVAWGSTHKGSLNEFVTADALFVLRFR
jgi:hypothetical protein